MSNSGYLLLEGGAEFGGRMSEPDRRAIALAGGFDAPICIIPTAAAPDHNDQRAGQNGKRWFMGLGARNVQVLPLVDRAASANPEIIKSLQQARLIYMLGGFPGHLAETLLDTLAWDAIQSALQNGAVVGGSSAGAMVMCEYFFDPYRGQLVPGLGLLPNTIVLPHHNRFGKNWAARLGQMLPGAILIGIDEQTGMIADSQDGCWRVYGRGSVTIYQNGVPRLIPDGQEFFLNTNS